MQAGEAHLSALVGRTVIAANAVVGGWAMLYAAISGHNLPYVASLFDKWAREDIQRERLAKLARDAFQKLPRALAEVEMLLATAEGLAREREMLVGQPWSLDHLDEHEAVPAAHGEARLEREAQFEALLSSLHALQTDIMAAVVDFRLSRDVEKLRLLNASAVLAAEYKFTKKTTRPKVGPRHKEWHSALSA